MNAYDPSLPARALLAQMGITDILKGEGVSEVAINRPNEVWYEKNSKWYVVENKNLTFDSCRKLANVLAISVAGKSNQLKDSPICPVALPDGERGQIVLPPATEKGCVSITIRKPSTSRFTLDSYGETGRLTGYEIYEQQTDIQPFEKEMVMLLKKGDLKKFFEMAVMHKLNLICGGATGSGKTTFLKAMADVYPKDRRYCTIEDVHELSLPLHPNRVHLFYGSHIESKKLVESCMRMKFDHIFMSELKGDETWSYFSLLNTGHNGSLTTAHFNDCNSAYSRLTELVKQTDIGATLDYDFIYQTAQKTLDIVTFWEGSYLKGIKYEPEKKLEIINGGSNG